MARFASLLKTRSRSLFGVDISAQRVKMLELDRSAQGFRVLSYASQPLAEGAIADHQIVEAEAVAEAIAHALERSGSRTRDAAIAVSGPAVISKIIDLPSVMDDAELEEHIHFDAAQYIPYPIEEVNIDFQVLERHPASEDMNRVLLVACRRDNIEMQVATLEMAGMKVRLVDVEEYALQNACRLLTAQQPTLDNGASVAVFDVGARNTRLTVHRNERSVYTREIAFGDQSLAERLLAAHDMSDIDQLQAHLRTGNLPASLIEPEIRNFSEDLASQIERSLQFYVSAAAAENEAIDQIIVVGGPTLYPGMEPALKSRLVQPVSLGNPLAGMLASSAARRNGVDFDAPSLMITAGLALRSFE
ncbi:MAG: type IV pilus assembly protein PilM [Salinisphaera sp.]|jgi:type IV pilus assembly protein PilM|nr:type IV pilus assembly protein PilM [Salinisphaera sp.]